MTSWASPRDVYPSSVHDLMSLWGDFSTAPNSDNGLEKRFEVDFARHVGQDELCTADIEIILAAADQCLLEHSCGGAMQSLTFSEALVLFNGRQFIVTADSSVHLHKLVSPLVKMLSEKNIDIEWASFCRKNISSPWDHNDTSDVMACEYAELKAAFADGQSFLTGPIDGEHFFHFIYDNIQRAAAVESGRVEEDVQLNAYFYNIQNDETNEKDRQSINILPDGTYTVDKVFPHAHCATFETNAPSAVHSKTKIASLLEQHQPARFTIIFFEDKDATKQNIRQVFSFDSYALNHKSVNYFGMGYAFHQLVFEKCE
ncbi:S-adenosylmethionine decarboxylase proenzyme [Angomonas deanei]|uniref:Adenosylmethionine decarboxylase, putative n=1 Tax=Angomonas deanei TaxID=59799 RepID=S9VCY8_9TRYP|nr:S-adenosylmethionine decarboxylase proenzyme [Angomonas deanei]EPY40792.1 S-adenosylmethionine decarboxylase proenzyme [Angomonas deanei]CAD2217946.1 Adenosylmethionine decarboxylase, putative [Angomonas deanei]|eukprot:EPY37451.1 S-adenosylmethionine decarboxylase proenzyme [Angomonas deanei]